MAFFDFLRPTAAKTAIRQMPIFPLNTVLFPGGVLGLQVFEARYLDMVTACLRQQSPFGICLAATGPAGDPHPEPLAIGTLAEILTADMAQAGILQLRVRGGARFRIRSRERQADGLWRAEIELFADVPPLAPPAERLHLLPLLMRIVNDLGPEKMPEPHAYDDAEWVSYRLTEILPVQNLAKQKLLELENPLVRLEILDRYLREHGLLGKN